MDIVIVVLLGLVLLIQVISLLRRSNSIDVVDRMNSLEKGLTKEIGTFKFEFSRYLKEDFDNLNKTIINNLDKINDRVNERLNVNFEKTNRTFVNVLERLSKIDEAQKKIDSLNQDIIGLQSILTDKKTRGIFGETNLNFILKSVFGEKNDSIYGLQYTLPNKMICDAILFAPEPLGTVAIDSKFPLENYQKMTNRKLEKSERDIAEKMFKADVKKHIDAISSKYIINGYTSSQAIMFLPAEAIFAEINAYHPDILTYAYKKSVWITSPTTLMSTLTIIFMLIKDMTRDKYAKIIHAELGKLSVEFKRYKERWEHLSRSIETVNKDVREIHTTTSKITKRFEEINNVDFLDDELPKQIETSS